MPLLVARRFLCFVLLLFVFYPVWAENIRSAYEPDFHDPFIESIKVLPQPPAGSRSVLMFEQSTGEILFQRNIDQAIPPASLTKLVVIALTLKHIYENGISLETKVPINPDAWAINAPPRSSLMFLEPKQTPTWKDLLLGLSVVSGNDAAVAVAEAIDGSVGAFVAHMNAYAKELGMKSTRFVEPSGYSELNLTTARDLGYFVWHYLQEFPNAIREYHSVLNFEYPYKEGLKTVKQGNRNDLLYDYPGADGLKTGYIDESGYNLAFTAARNGMRLSGIVLGGATDKDRFKDAEGILDYGFGRFTLVDLPVPDSTTIRVWKGSQTLLTTEPVAARVALPIDLVRSLKSRDKYLREVLAPLSVSTPVGEQVFYNSEGRAILAFPIAAGKSVNESNVLLSWTDDAILSLRSIFGRAKPKNSFEVLSP